MVVTQKIGNIEYEQKFRPAPLEVAGLWGTINNALEYSTVNPGTGERNINHFSDSGGILDPNSKDKVIKMSQEQGYIDDTDPNIQFFLTRDAANQEVCIALTNQNGGLTKMRVQDLNSLRALRGIATDEDFDSITKFINEKGIDICSFGLQPKVAIRYRSEKPLSNSTSDNIEKINSFTLKRSSGEGDSNFEFEIPVTESNIEKLRSMSSKTLNKVRRTMNIGFSTIPNAVFQILTDSVINPNVAVVDKDADSAVFHSNVVERVYSLLDLHRSFSLEIEAKNDIAKKAVEQLGFDGITEAFINALNLTPDEENRFRTAFVTVQKRKTFKLIKAAQ